MNFHSKNGQLMNNRNFALRWQSDAAIFKIGCRLYRLYRILLLDDRGTGMLTTCPELHAVALDSNPRSLDRKSSNLTTRPPANPVVKKIHHSRASGIPIGKWDSPRVFPLTCKRLFYHSIANRFTGRNSFIDIAESKPLERRKRFTMHSL